MRWQLSGLCATLGALSLAACAENPVAERGSGAPSFTISDAVHSAGTPGFYFLPPMVTAPTASGTPDADLAGLAPEVAICDVSADTGCGSVVTALAVFTTSSMPAISLDADHYQVNWDTKAPGFDAGHTYRLHVRAGTAGSRRELGFADVLLTATPGQAKNVATDDVIVLNDGRTLPIKFRIEAGIPGALTVGVSPATVPLGGSAVALASVSDLHGTPLSGASVSWSATGAPVTLATPSGPSTGVTAGNTPGTATITAAVSGLGASTPLEIESPPALFISVRGSDAVMMFSLSASGNASPMAVLQGSSTGLHQPYGVVRDPAGRLIVANYTSNSVTTFAPGASGNAAPLSSIQGPHTGLSGPVGITRDNAGYLYVANDQGQSVTVYAPGASGDASPVASISGSQTLLSGPAGLVVDQAGRLYVANTCCGPAISGNRVTVYAPGATGNVAPVAVIAGPNTGLQRPHGLALSSTGFLYVASSNGAAIQIFAPGADGDVAPVGTIAGAATGLATPLGMTFASDGSLYVVNWGANNILVFPAGSTGNALPSLILGGPATLLTDPMFVSF